MEAKNLNVSFCVAKMEELDENDRSLVETAIEATERSYAPYSPLSSLTAAPTLNWE